MTEPRTPASGTAPVTETTDPGAAPTGAAAAQPVAPGTAPVTPGAAPVAPSGLTGIPGVAPAAPPPSPAPTMQPWPSPAAPPVPTMPPGPDAADVARETFQNLTTTTRTLLAGLDPTGWRPTLIVAGIIAALVLGTQLINAAIPTPGARPIGGGPVGPSVPGAPVAVTNDVRFVLVSGWQVTQRFTDQLPGVAIQKGDVFMEMRATANTVNGSASDLIQQFRGILAGQLAAFQSTPPTPVSTNGLNGLRMNYQGTNRNGNVQEGVMFVFVSPGGTGVLAHAGGQRGSIEPLLNEIQAMVGSLEAR